MSETSARLFGDDLFQAQSSPSLVALLEEQKQPLRPQDGEPGVPPPSRPMTVGQQGARGERAAGDQAQAGGQQPEVREAPGRGTERIVEVSTTAWGVTAALEFMANLKPRHVLRGALGDVSGVERTLAKASAKGGATACATGIGLLVATHLRREQLLRQRFSLNEKLNQLKMASEDPGPKGQQATSTCLDRIKDNLPWL